MDASRSLAVDVPLDETDFASVSLMPRQVMHGAAEQTPLDDRVSLAPPRVITLDANPVTALAGDVIDLHAINHPRPLRFCLLTIDIGFHHVTEEPIVQAAISTRLFNEPPNGHPEPVAIAMIPGLATRAIKRSSTIKLGVNLQVVSSEASRTVEHESGEPYLQAHKPGRSDPAWFFKRTQDQELAGPHQLLAVIAMPPDGHCKALVDLSASIRRRRAGLIGYEAQLRPDFGLVDLV